MPDQSALAGRASHLISSLYLPPLLRSRFTSQCGSYSEVRATGVIEDNCLAVEDQGRWAERLRRHLDRWETMRPVMAATREDAHATRLDMHCQAVTVPFDLKCPVVNRRHSLGKKRKARLDTVRHRVKWQTRLIRIARLGWLAAQHFIAVVKQAL